LLEALKQINAAEVCRFNDSLESEVDEPDTRYKSDGAKKQYYVTKYERIPGNRAAAIEEHKRQHGELCCSVCGFHFEKTYGEQGANFIEVHHIKPLSSREGEDKNFDPKTDLICLCSNCHSMIHRKRDSILTPEKLKMLVEEQKYATTDYL